MSNNQPTYTTDIHILPIRDCEAFFTPVGNTVYLDSYWSHYDLFPAGHTQFSLVTRVKPMAFPEPLGSMGRSLSSQGIPFTAFSLVCSRTDEEDDDFSREDYEKELKEMTLEQLIKETECDEKVFPMNDFIELWNKQQSQTRSYRTTRRYNEIDISVYAKKQKKSQIVIGNTIYPYSPNLWMNWFSICSGVAQSSQETHLPTRFSQMVDFKFT